MEFVGNLLGKIQDPLDAVKKASLQGVVDPIEIVVRMFQFIELVGRFQPLNPIRIIHPVTHRRHLGHPEICHCRREIRYSKSALPLRLEAQRRNSRHSKSRRITVAAATDRARLSVDKSLFGL
jgi:hypothetical protein